MAIEHSCHICGRALGRVRAPLDPIYLLPIVVCPKCGAASVRRRHPLSVTSRALRRWLATGVGLGWRAAACALAVMISLALCEMLSDSLNSVGPLGLWRMSRDGTFNERWIESWKHENGPLIAGLAAVWCVAIGAALTAGFGHVKSRWKLWAALAGALFGLLIFMGLASFLSQAQYRQAQGQEVDRFLSCFWQLDRCWGWIVIGLLIAVVGMPLGRALRRAFVNGDARRWSAMRRRARRRRMPV